MRFGLEVRASGSLIILLLLSFSLVVSAGLHFTDSEIFAATTCQPITALGWTACEKTEWNVRRASGPYKNSGDVSNNSPGDGARNDSQAAQFLATPSMHRYSGATTCPLESSPYPPRYYGTNMISAAFIYFLTGNTSYRTAVQNELLAQAAVTGTNFANTTLFCDNGNENLDWPNWITRLAVAYDFIRADISSDNRTTLDAWFLAGAQWVEKNLHSVAAKRWPNRKSDSYGTSLMPLGFNEGNPYYGAMFAYNWHKAWNNKASAMAKTFGLIGIMLTNTTLRTEAKRYFREWVKYHLCYTNCGDLVTVGEYWRCCTVGQTPNRFPNLGYHYVGTALANMVFLADLFARKGDFDLYNYSSTEGYNGTEGGPKTLQAAIQTHLDMGRNVIRRCGRQQGTDPASQCNSSHNNVDYEYPGDNITGYNTSVGNKVWHSVEETYAATIANIYYRSTAWKSAYLRTAVGSLPYSANPNGGWMFEAGALPGHMFMFSQMEGKVWPYPNPVPFPTSVPPNPTEFVVTK